jgi:hypothetical protein
MELEPRRPSGIAELPPSLHAAIDQARSGGRPLPAALRQSLAPRLRVDAESVRIHTGAAAARGARALGARAFTLGRDIVFGAGEYSPASSQGRQLIAHEVAHAAQQGPAGSVVQRAPEKKSPAPEIESYVWLGDKRQKRDKTYAEQRGRDVADRLLLGGTLTKELRAELNGMLAFFEGDAKDAYISTIKPALQEVTAGKKIERQPPGPKPIERSESIREFVEQPAYIDNNIKKVSFFTAELAIIEYRDGTKFELGLSPKWMKAPVVEVDYVTPIQALRPISSRAGYGFMNEIELQNVRGLSWGDVQKKFTHNVEYFVEPKTGRIIPSRINELTAPTLTRVLRASAEQFGENVKFGVEFGMQMTKVVGLMGGGGNLRGAAAPLEASASRVTTRVVMSRAAARLQAEFEQLLASGAGAARGVTVEGVTFGAVRVAEESGVLNVARVSIKRLENTMSGAGRAANAAFEDAAMALARSRGLRTIRINVGNIMNPKWREYMESIGYVRTTLDRPGGGFEIAWIREITL